MRRGILFLNLVAWAVPSLGAIQAPSTSSLQWTLTIAKEARQPGEPFEAGTHLLLGPQQEVGFHVGLGNFRGPAVDASSMIDRVQVSLERDGHDVPITIERAISAPSPPQYLAEGDGLGMSFTLTLPDGNPFDFGTYWLSVSVVDAVRSLKNADGTPWSGQVKMVDRRRLILREPRGRDELRTFWRIEGNVRLGKRQPREAIPYLETLATDLPDDWQAEGALGEAYLETKQYELAAAAFEKALPGWLKFQERRGDLVASSLAQTYLALGREADAVRVLRSIGVPESEIPKRLRALRPANQ